MSDPTFYSMDELIEVERVFTSIDGIKTPFDTPVINPFKLECVVVCDKYSDFLARTLPTNKFLFDQLVVVTSYEDIETQRVCEFYHVKCVKTDDLNSRKKEFHKGKGINAGLKELKNDGWVVHLDADMVLPPQTRILIETAKLDPHMIYGIDRFIVKGFHEWDEFLSMPKLQHENDSWLHPNAFPIGHRVMYSFVGGYLPIGFFQMWCPKVSGVKKYPESHTNAGRGDSVFAQQWPRPLRAMIPELIGYHLESVDSVMSSNWDGRTTKTFAINPKSPNRLP